MNILKIEGTDDTAEIMLNKASGQFEIKGRSLPEDSAEFFAPVLEWIDQYKKEPNPTTEFRFRLDYFNTASSKMIQDILVALEGIEGAKVLWYYLEDDEDMEEQGREFAELVSIPFEFIAV
jgi:hypothetical protein